MPGETYKMVANLDVPESDMLEVVNASVGTIAGGERVVPELPLKQGSHQWAVRLRMRITAHPEGDDISDRNRRVDE